MITVTQMEYVLAVARERNFRRAADSCHVTQPTLSVQVQKFEETINTIVFDRSKSPISPTRLGEKIIEQVRIAYTEALRVVEVAEQDSGVVSGELRVGVIPTISPYLVPLFLKSLNQKNPDLELTISELTTENCLLELDQENIDVAILATKESRKKYQQDFLYEEEMLLYTHVDHRFSTKKKISADELEARDIWLLEDGHCLKDEIVKVCELGRELKNRPRNLNLKVGNLEALRSLVEENFGYTLLPYLSTLKLSKSKKAVLKSLSNPQPTRIVNLTKKKGVLKTASIGALKDEILGNLPRDITKI